MSSIIGICNLHDGPHLGALTEKRPLGAVSFLGRYGLMDFALSNLSNSGIDKVCILVEKGMHAILSHVGNGQIWINNTRTGYQRVLFNEKGVTNDKFNTDINNLIQNQAHFDNTNNEYYAWTVPFFIMKLDFNKVLESHKASGSDITLVYKHVKNADKEFLNCDTIEIKDGKVFSFGSNTGRKLEQNISLETVIINSSLFSRILSTCKNVSRIFNMRDIIKYLLEKKEITINTYEFDGSVYPILSLDDYVKESFKLLDYSERKTLFDDEWPIYTTTHNTPPSLYGSESEVKNSFIANGSIIKGKVVNSIISRDVIVDKGAVIEDSIVFTGSTIGKNVHLKNVLADKDSHFDECKEVSPKEEDILYIKSGARI